MKLINWLDWQKRTEVEKIWHEVVVRWKTYIKFRVAVEENERKLKIPWADVFAVDFFRSYRLVLERVSYHRGEWYKQTKKAILFSYFPLTKRASLLFYGTSGDRSAGELTESERDNEASVNSYYVIIY